MIHGKKNTMALSHLNGIFQVSLPILKGQNYENWCKQLKVIFCCQDLWDLMDEGVTPLVENATDEENVAHKELKNKDYKGLFIIY